jgi:four helix bundle protein
MTKLPPSLKLRRGRRMTNDEGMTKSEMRDARSEDLFWDDSAGFVREEAEAKRVYDLEERTARFGEAIIDFAKTIPQNPVTTRIISQLVGAGTSVGANYVEADNAVSKPRKLSGLKSIGTCRKEARNQAFSSNDCSASAGTETGSSSALGGSKGTASDLLQNLEKQVKN